MIVDEELMYNNVAFNSSSLEYNNVGADDVVQFIFTAVTLIFESRRQCLTARLRRHNTTHKTETCFFFSSIFLSFSRLCFPLYVHIKMREKNPAVHEWYETLEYIGKNLCELLETA